MLAAESRAVKCGSEGAIVPSERLSTLPSTAIGRTFATQRLLRMLDEEMSRRLVIIVAAVGRSMIGRAVMVETLIVVRGSDMMTRGWTIAMIRGWITAKTITILILVTKKETTGRAARVDITPVDTVVSAVAVIAENGAEVVTDGEEAGAGTPTMIIATAEVTTSGKEVEAATTANAIKATAIALFVSTKKNAQTGDRTQDLRVISTTL